MPVSALDPGGLLLLGPPRNEAEGQQTDERSCLARPSSSSSQLMPLSVADAPSTAEFLPLCEML